ncbi:hypothetical protein CPB85DRAFT_304449 [Mucidula mucida]|nr:hypothetical protein CPB85DRAFT_304449 [Mucidula mucida]
MTVMNDISRPRLLALATILASLVVQAGAQSGVVPATCPANEEWAYNSANQSVCAVASNLAAVCNPQQIYTIPALSRSGDVYGGPLKGDECRCNSVFYSLLSACGFCQGYHYIKWSLFIRNCTDPKVGSYPEDIPQGTAVFDWAYDDVLVCPTIPIAILAG